MNNDNQHIPSGYKPSPLGIIPKEWEVKRLGECTNLLTNGFVGVATPHYTEDSDGITYIQGYNVTEGGFNLRGIKKVTKEFHKKNSKSSLLEGDLLTIQTGDIGLTTIVPKDLEGSNCHALIISRFNNSIIPRFMLYYYNSSIGRERFRKIETGTTMKHINTGDLINFLVPVPSIEEQKAIVDLLKLWDTAIAKQTILIEQLTLRKRGLMQQLLTGKKRLKGFEGKWKEVRLGDVAFVIGGGTPNTNIPDYWDGDIPWFTPSEIGENKYVNISERTISEKGLNDSSAKILPKGTILFTSRATIGAKAILTTEATTNQGFQSLVVTNGNNNEFIYYYLDIIINEIKQKASGSTFPEVSAESIRKTAIKIPNVNEQNAIASVLVNADKEIEIQKQKLTAMQEQKKGLMQVLLTGKKRISIK